MSTTSYAAAAYGLPRRARSPRPTVGGAAGPDAVPGRQSASTMARTTASGTANVASTPATRA